MASGGFNFPPLVFGVLGFIQWCPYFSNWFVGNTTLAGLNMVMSVYCVHKIRRTTRGPHGSMRRPQQGDVSAETANDHKSDSDTDSNSNTHEPPIVLSPPRRQGCFSRLIHYRTPSSDRIRHLICYDGILTTYSIIFLVWIFWLSEGLQRMRQEDFTRMEEEESFDGCFAYHERYMTTSLVCGFAYFGFVVAAGIASLCYPSP